MTTSQTPPSSQGTAERGDQDVDGRASRFGVDGTGVATDDYNRSIEFDAGSRPPVHPRTTRIVVGLDGSAASLGALSRAVKIATAMNATVQGVIAWSLPSEWSLPSIYGNYGLANWSPESDSQQMMAAAVSTTFEGNTPTWFIPTIRQGNPAEILIDESRGAEMLIVGCRGHGGFAGLLLGSVSMACAAHAHCPVLIMHDDDDR
ncbi:universal stress protein [Agreia sp. Leaf210]|uniref:universal stress protein n=1 Tax=Agreia sp. Leaf210 TaxID=1735682 RepID=UPI0006FBBDB7|nr:universal stress protein [Agreia sp. Leaf210]KQM60711.1 hypothetical protein ASE64_03385 [Agreia sp. Leaf210]